MITIFEQPSKQVLDTHDVQDQDSYELATPQNNKCRLTNVELSKKQVRVNELEYPCHDICHSVDSLCEGFYCTC